MMHRRTKGSVHLKGRKKKKKKKKQKSETRRKVSKDETRQLT